MRSVPLVCVALMLSVLACDQPSEPRQVRGAPPYSGPEPAAAPVPVAEAVPTAPDDSAALVPATVEPKALPPIYDLNGEGAAMLGDARSKAASQQKRILITVGGNWCTWCHKLHMLFERHAGIASRLEKSYVELLLDTDAQGALVKDLGIELRGVPFLAVLDAEGKVLVQQETGSLESGPRHDPVKVLAFLDANAGS